MVKPIIRSALRVVAVVVIVLGIVGFIGWRVMHPTFSKVPMAEIRAVLPLELLETSPPDIEAGQRFDGLEKLAKGMESDAVEAFAVHGYPPAMGKRATVGLSDSKRYHAAVNYWRRRPRLLDQLQTLVQAGPLHAPGLPATQLNSLELLRALVTSAELYAEYGLFDASATLMTIAIEDIDGLQAGDGDVGDFIVHSIFQGIVISGISTALTVPGFPANDLRLLLEKLSPAPKSDVGLRICIRGEFQGEYLPVLPDGKRVWQEVMELSKPLSDAEAASEEPIGRYDAVETATILGKCFAIRMKNAIQPLSKLDTTDQQLEDQAARGLPFGVDGSNFARRQASFARFAGRFAMNTTHNSLGRVLISRFKLWSKNLVVFSCRQRTDRETARVLIASMLYRASHGGKLPADKSGLIPYLGSWPQDPFNGKELIYDAKAEKVYSVGENLVDDHGNLTYGSNSVLDDGLSLKVGG